MMRARKRESTRERERERERKKEIEKKREKAIFFSKNLSRGLERVRASESENEIQSVIYKFRLFFVFYLPRVTFVFSFG